MLDTVVIGAGQAGLGISYCLARDGVDHLVLERERVGETWRGQRWESFMLNTPNEFSALPGAPYEGDRHDGFSSADELVDMFERYVRVHDLPVRTGTTVTSVDRAPDGSFDVSCDEVGMLRTRNVVVATGMLNAPKMPGIGAELDPRITQLHASAYRSPDALRPGGVLVVGSGQSGCQIAEDLLDGGRGVYLATSRVGRIPRRYRGRDIFDWAMDIGFFDMTVDELEHPDARFDAQPQLSGVGRNGHTVSLQSLADAGVTLLGRLQAVNGQQLRFADDLAANVTFGDDVSAKFKETIDAHIRRAGLDPQPNDDDPADHPHPHPSKLRTPTHMDLRARDVSTIIWCTGSTADFAGSTAPCSTSGGRPSASAARPRPTGCTSSGSRGCTAANPASSWASTRTRTTSPSSSADVSHRGRCAAEAHRCGRSPAPW